MKCKLCLKNEADKTGSHLVPHFLLKRIENIEGKKGRDYEIGFLLGDLDSKFHFGRSVPPEKLKELLGDLSDEEISNNKHPFIIDNIFCSDCEKRFSVIENIYANTLKKVENIEYESGVSFHIGMLFWISIIWRISTQKILGFSLNETNQELLRQILDSFLPKSIKEINDKKFATSKITENISYKLLRCSNCETERNKWLFIFPNLENVICIVIDEFLLVLSLNGNYDEIYNNDCYGMNNYILNAPVNTNSGNEIILPFDKTSYKSLIERIIKELNENFFNELNQYLDDIYKQITGRRNETMPLNIKQEIIKEIITGQSKIGRKYTLREIVRIIIKKLIKHNIIKII